MKNGSQGVAAGCLRWAKMRASLLTAVLLVTLVISLAIANPGVSTTRVDVNDGGIWVTDSSRQLVGHLNYESRTIDAAFRTETAEFDIHQFKETVTFDNQGMNAVAPVDVAGVRLGTATSLMERALVMQGGERLTVLDPAEGNLWVAKATAPASTQYVEGTALATDLEGGAVTVALDGTTVALGPKAKRFVLVSPRASLDAIDSVDVPDLSAAAQLSVTAVGSQPVGLDSRNNALILPDGSLRPLSEEGIPTGGVLQQPGPDASYVLLATADALFRIPLDGSEATELNPEAEKSGVPAAPVRLNGCEYAAWAGSGAYLRNCDLNEQLTLLTVESLQQATEVKFRTNRDLIVLNDLGSGNIWLPDHNMMLAADWDEIEAQLEEDEKADDSPDISQEIADPENHEKNTPPEAQDDALGARPGSTTTLDVLANDSDDDGDVLTARPVEQPKLGTVTRTRGGQALQIALPEDATGTTNILYEASDGQAVATATARVEVHPWSVNDGPEQLRDPGVKLGSKAEVEYNVLPDWRDPDGDPIFLENVTAPSWVQVFFREEGTITIRDLGSSPGSVKLDVVVSDGKKSTKGNLTVQVQQPGNLPPVANADFYVARVGETVLIQPLANDSDPNGDAPRLSYLSPAPEGTTVVPEMELGTFTFAARAEGTYNLSYTISDGPATAIGVIRIDVVAPEGTAKPVAEDDMVLLPKGGAALSSPLNNDSDPAGGVLVLQSVEVPESAGIQVTMVDRHLLRVTSSQGIEDPVSFTYWVSNGQSTASAKVLVVPTKTLDTGAPPEPQPDRTKVRVGDIASVPVLANDRSPSGLDLRVDTHLEYTPNPEIGQPFVTGNQVRLKAGKQPGVLHVAYTVRDSAGNMATSTVMFEVVPHGGANAAPRPKDLTAWAVSGQNARIPVPLGGIDPDGDSVTLVGIEQPPQLGNVTLGTDWLEYTPGDKLTGTDVFTYIVEDRLGKQATARVRVGIAPPSATNQAPSAVRDTLLVRPNRSLSVPVLDNDIDPDGDPLELTEDGLVPQSKLVEPSIRENTIEVDTPAKDGSYAISYQVSDGRGGTSEGVLTLNVQSDASLVPPIARDDVVPLAELPSDNSPVTVSVLENDEDPDGNSRLLTVSCDDPDVVVSGNQLQIVPTEQRRLVVYTVTDEDGLTGSAIVSVPGKVRERPTVDEQKVPVEVRAGQELVLDLNDYVITREGRTPRIADPESIKASLGASQEPAMVNDYTLSFTADKKFSGDTSVSFMVSDGPANDDSALTASLTIPIKVVPTTNHPPTLTPTPLRISAGEEAVVSDLSLMVSDPDSEDPTTFSYTLLDAPDGIVTELDGHKLSVKAALSHEKGAAGTIGVGVDDGSGVVTAQIPVSVVSSTRPLIQTSDAIIEAANAGGTEYVDLAEYTINPFPDHPIRIASVSITGKGNVDPQGTVLEITPAVGYHGEMTVNYKLLDATGDRDRMVEGQVRLVVRARPDPPSGVSVTATGAGEALVTFTPGADNGAPITKFTLTDHATGQTYQCQVASCPLSGLANGVKHSFSVIAHNAVGESGSSETSAPVLIDMRPGKPAPPTGTAKDGSITVTWKPPTNKGSAITGYTLFQHPGGAEGQDAGGKGIDLPADQTSYTATNLKNGTSYTFAVQAHNSAEEPSEVSETSAGLVPFGPPAAPTSIDYAYQSPESPDLVKLKVSWAYPASNNGRAFDKVRITSNRGETVIDSDGSVTSADVQVNPAQEVTIKVALHTEGGWSPETSVSLQAASIPVGIAAPQVAPTGQNGELKVSGAAVKPGNGYQASQLSLQYSTDGKSWKALEGAVLSGFDNGKAVKLQFRQVSAAVTDHLVAGPIVAAKPATPYGPPIQPKLSATSEGNRITFSWQAVATNGGPKVTKLLLRVGDKEEEVSGLTGNKTFETDPGTRLQATITACDSSGKCTTSEPAAVQAWGTYQAQVTACAGNEEPVLPAPDPNNPDAPVEACHTFQAQLDQNWPGGTELTCTFTTELDQVPRIFKINTPGAWQASGIRINQAEVDTIGDWVGTRLVCNP